VCGDDYFPLGLSDTDRYYRSALDLHIHFTFGDFDLCAIAQNLVDVSDGWTPTRLVRRCTESERELLESSGVHGQVSVTVDVGEAVEDTEIMHIGIGIPGTITRLQSLEDCNSIRVHKSGVSGPPFPVIQSLLILPWLGGVPHTLPEDWKADVAPLRLRNQTASEVVESRPDVIKKVRSNQVDTTVDLPREAKAVDLTLALNPYAHRVWVAVAIRGNFQFEIDEMFFSPFQLEQARRDNQVGHATP